MPFDEPRSPENDADGLGCLGVLLALALSLPLWAVVIFVVVRLCR